MDNVRFIDTQDDWERAAAELSAQPFLALDTESNNQYAYCPQVCLIQLGTPQGNVVILDPLAVSDLARLGEILVNPAILKVIHAAVNDLEWLNRDYAFCCDALFDTQIAARLLGVAKTNLGALLNGVLGVDIPKSKRLQTSNWGARPLSAAALEYAANDVRYLPRLALALQQRLRAAGRMDWALEECRKAQQVRYQPPTPPEERFMRVKGAQQLKPQELAALRELFLLREAEAAAQNRPPFKVIGNDALLRLARLRPDGGPAALAASIGETAGLPKDLPAWFTAQIAEAIESGWQSPEIHWTAGESGPPSRTPDCAYRLARLKQWLERRGGELGLEPSLLWPTASLERMAANPAACLEELTAAAEVRQWQRREFAQRLAEICAAPEWQQGGEAAAADPA